jgi:hypothetical protein
MACDVDGYPETPRTLMKVLQEAMDIANELHVQIKSLRTDVDYLKKMLREMERQRSV